MLLQTVPQASAGLPVSQLDPELSELLRPFLEAAAREMVKEIQGLVPEYARPPDSKYGQRMSWVISETIRSFVDCIGRPDLPLDAITRVYVEIGVHEARKGRSLDGLQTAIRMSGQVACRRFIKDARRLDWPLETLGLITESLFVYLETIASAAGRGYADAREQLTTENERRRRRLRDLLVADPPASHQAVSELAAAANWPLPKQMAVVVLRRPPGADTPVLPPGLLADWECPEPYLIVPHPDAAGHQRLVEVVAKGGKAAVGPPVAPTGGALSLRWARDAMRLVDRGVLPADGPVRCLDHVATLAVSSCEELIRIAARTWLEPLKEVRPHRREAMVRTLLSYLKHGGNAVTTAEELKIHEQTVRYRMRNLEQVFGDLLQDADRKIELLLLLHAWTELGGEQL